MKVNRISWEISLTNAKPQKWAGLHPTTGGWSPAFKMTLVWLQLTHQDELFALYKNLHFQPIQIHPTCQSPGIPIQFVNSSRPQFRNQRGDFFAQQVVNLEGDKCWFGETSHMFSSGGRLDLFHQRQIIHFHKFLCFHAVEVHTSSYGQVMVIGAIPGSLEATFWLLAIHFCFNILSQQRIGHMLHDSNWT